MEHAGSAQPSILAARTFLKGYRQLVDNHSIIEEQDQSTLAFDEEDFSDDDILSFISYVRENEVIVYLSEGPVAGTFKRHKILDQNGNIGWCHIHYWMWEPV